MAQEFHIVNAFTNDLFGGNPAAVCIMDAWPSDDRMQAIAAQHNLSETAFLVAAKTDGVDYDIRWFTPTCEVKLCGHSTLAAAHVLFIEKNKNEQFSQNLVNKMQSDEQELNSFEFASASGHLMVHYGADAKIMMDFPQAAIQKTAILGTYQAVFGVRAVSAFCSPNHLADNQDLILLFESPLQVQNAEVNYKALQTLNFRSVTITAKATDVDFVCRVFAPNEGIDEDPVTGSAFTMLTPLWHTLFAEENMQKETYHARQVSKRKGDVWTSIINEDRVMIAGFTKLYAKGMINL